MHPTVAECDLETALEATLQDFLNTFNNPRAVNEWHAMFGWCLDMDALDSMVEVGRVTLDGSVSIKPNKAVITQNALNAFHWEYK